MAMETEVARSDTQTVLKQIEEFIRKLLKLFTLKVVMPLSKRATSYIYRHNISGKNRVLKDGPTKETDRIKDLSYEESVSILIDYQQQGIKTYIVAENSKDDITGRRKTEAATEKFAKIARDLRKAKSDLADKPQNKRLQNKVNKLQKEYTQKIKQMEDGFDENKYNTLVKEAITKKFPKDHRKSELDLSEEERDEIYEKSCSGKPIKFTVVTNAKWKAQNERTRERILEERTAKKQQKIDDILSVTKTEEYEKMPYDEEKFNEMVSSMKEKLGRELDENELNDIKGQCKYTQITVEQFKEDAEKDNVGYCIYQYDKDRADTICRELNSNDDIEKFACEYVNDNNGNRVVNVYIYDKDDILYEHKEGVPFQHCRNLEQKTPADEMTNQSTTGNALFAGTQITIDYEQLNNARRIFKDYDYSLNIITNDNGKKQAQLLVQGLTERDVNKMLIEEKRANVVQESLLKHKENDKQRTRNEAKLLNNSSVITMISELRKKADENETTKAFVDKYDEFKQINNNNDLSTDKYNEFYNAFFNDKEQLNKVASTLPEKDIKSVAPSNNVQKVTETKDDLAENEFIVDNFDNFADLELDGKD